MLRRFVFKRCLLLLCLFALLLISGASAAQKRSPSQRKPNRQNNKAPKGSISDREYTKRRTACTNVVAQECVDKEIDLENCVMKCISQSCYDKTFPEPLEEGEVAFERTNRFKRCAKEDLKAAYRRGEML